MYRKFSVFIMGLVILAGGLFSAFNTFMLFEGIFGADLAGYAWSLAGLALFDLGALGWLLHFAHSAKGNAQRAIAAICGALCLVLTLAAAGTHVLLTQTLVTVPLWAGQVAVGSILVALAINIIGAAANHMADPDTLKAMREQQLNDEKQEAIERAQMAIFRESLRQTEARVASNAAYVSSRLSGEFATDATREMLAMTSGGHSAPLADVRVVEEPKAKEDLLAAPLYSTLNGVHKEKAHGPKS